MSDDDTILNAIQGGGIIEETPVYVPDALYWRWSLEEEAFAMDLNEEGDEEEKEVLIIHEDVMKMQRICKRAFDEVLSFEKTLKIEWWWSDG